jgi:hydrogenase expression/formation protein HypC
MCLAIPMRIVALDGVMAVAEVDGVSRRVRLDLLPEVSLGDYVLIHAGLAIARVDAAHAEETLSLLRSLADEVY